MRKYRISWLLLLILSLVGISFYGGVVSYSIFFILLLVPVICLLYMAVVAFTFKIYQDMDKSDVVAGQTNDYYFTIQNDMPFAFAGLQVVLFPDFFEVLDVPNGVEYELQPGDEFCFRTKLTCKYRGVYEVGVRYVMISDFLHLFHLKYKLISTYKVTVRPRVPLLNELKSMEQIVTQQTRENLYGKNLPDIVTRDYIPGDSLRRIHWKASAKTGELKVRTFYDEKIQKIHLYFEPKRYSQEPKIFLPLENRIIEVVLAVTSYFAYQNLYLQVSWGMEEDQCFRVSDHKSFEPFYEKVAELIFDKDVNVEANREAFFTKAREDASQIYYMILHEITQEILMNTQEMVDRGDYVVIYLVTQDSVDGISDTYLAFSNERRQIITIRTEEEYCEKNF